MKILLLLAVSLITCIQSTAQNVVQAEYFLDVDAGFGSNTPVTLSNPQPDGTYNFNINLAGVSRGYHKLYIRVKDSNGKWSFTSRRNIEVTSSNSNKRIVGGEYFFDTDPGFNAATPITVDVQDLVVLQNFAATTNALPIGYHKLYIRLKDIDGNWSLTARRNVEVINTPVYLVAGAEFFFNNDPGPGTATPVAFSTPLADGSFSFKIPLASIPAGAYRLYIRARDSINHRWSITQWQTDSVVTSIKSGLWSQPATWSNNKVPDINTIVLLYHNVEVDITDAVCRSLTTNKSDVLCTIQPGKALRIAGHQ